MANVVALVGTFQVSFWSYTVLHLQLSGKCASDLCLGKFFRLAAQLAPRQNSWFEGSLSVGAREKISESQQMRQVCRTNASKSRTSRHGAVYGLLWVHQSDPSRDPGGSEMIGGFEDQRPQYIERICPDERVADSLSA